MKNNREKQHMRKDASFIVFISYISSLIISFSAREDTGNGIGCS